MREKGQAQTEINLPSPCESTATDEVEGTQSENETPTGPVKRVNPAITVKKKGKKVNFSSPPKWRNKHAVGGGSKNERTPLKPLTTNTKRLVGRGSPRIPTVGKGKSSKLKQTVITCTSPLSTQRLSRQTERSLKSTTEQGTQTETQACETNVTSSLDYRMCTEEEPPLEYWRILAEQRRVALAETLQENKELYTEVGTLKNQVVELETKVQDLEYFAMMYKLASNSDS